MADIAMPSGLGHHARMSDLPGDEYTGPEFGRDARRRIELDLAAAAADYDLVREAIRQVRGQMSQIVEQLDDVQEEQRRQARLIDGQLARLDQAAGSLLAAGPGQDPGPGFAVTQLASAARLEVKSGRRQFPGVRWDAAWDWMKRLYRRLWSMLSHLLHVKEWSVTGQVGTGPLGLASASLAVTFGPAPARRRPRLLSTSSSATP
jgi:hypothetical protein